MEALQALSLELGQPSANKLYLTAQSRGLDVTRDLVNALVKQQSGRQILAARPKYEGKIVATKVNDRWAADLIDYAERQAEGYQYILLVQDIFSRKVWGVATKDKKAATVLGAFEHIVRSAGKPRELDTDQGPEFEYEFDDYLEEENIIHTIADKRNKNARGSLDYAIGSIRATLARLTMATKKKWNQLVPDAVHAVNETVHKGIISRTPAQVAKDKDAQFLLRERAANDLQTNEKQIEKRGAKLERQGAFREELPPKEDMDKERSFLPRYGDQVHRVDKVVGGTVFSGDKPYQTRHVLPVPVASAPANSALLRTREAQRDRERLAKLEPFRQQIQDFVGNGKWIHDVARHMSGLGIVLKGFNYKTALLLLGYKVEANGRVTRPRVRIRNKRRV